MDWEEVRAYVNQYCRLRDLQFAAYEMYARSHGLTAKELFVLDLIWFAPEGCMQADICERLSATKQTVSAIIKKFLKKGYVILSESATDRRSKIIHLTDAGREYVEKIIPPAADAEIAAMAELTGEDIAELVRLTTRFSQCMSKRFQEAREVQQ